MLCADQDNIHPLDRFAAANGVQATGIHNTQSADQ
jgi:hypothetical protein